jgi:hypothetical protein
MSWPEFYQAVKDGGWIILVVYFVYKELWPLITNKLIPASMRTMESQRLERAAELESERLFRREMDQDRSKTLAAISEAIGKLSVSMAQTNERIATLLANQQLIISQQSATFGILSDAIGDMKAATARRRSGDLTIMGE